MQEETGGREALQAAQGGTSGGGVMWEPQSFPNRSQTLKQGPALSLWAVPGQYNQGILRLMPSSRP